MAKQDFPRRADESGDLPTDPTVLIDRASLRAPADEVEKTIIIQRPDPGRKPRAETTPRAPQSAKAEPTVIRPQGKGSAQPRVASTGPARPSRSWLASMGRGPRHPSGGSSAWGGSGVRGAVLALAAVAAAGLLVAGAVLAWHWLGPSGYSLVVTKPDHGSVLGEGIECGSRGEACTVAAAKGQRIELAPDPDNGYVFVGFSGDCANGWVVMSGPRTCVATFRPIGQAPQPVTYPLTIDKPNGGTIQGLGGIECGLMGSSCTADLANGIAVKLYPKPDTGFVFLNFTGECSADGTTRMIAPRRCGAVFAAKGQTPAPGPAAPLGPIGPKPKAPEFVTAAPPKPASPDGGTPAPSTGGTGQPTATPAAAKGADTQPPPPPTTTPAPPIITAEEHAKTEIQQLVVSYCDALKTLKPAEVKKLYPLADVQALKTGFKELRSLKCSITTPVKYVALHPEAAGSATIEFGFKQERVMSSNGAPDIKETEVTMRLARQNFNSRWLIDYLHHEVKKP